MTTIQINLRFGNIIRRYLSAKPILAETPDMAVELSLRNTDS
jgi:hypothetical protein